MSLHPPKQFIIALSAPKAPAARVTMKVFGGVFTVSKAHTRRPRVHRLEVSKARPKGYGSPLNPEGA